MPGDEPGVGGQTIRGEMARFSQQIDGAGNAAVFGDDGQVGGGPKAHGCDQRMVEENRGEFGGGIGDKGQRAGDTEVIPRIPVQRFGAMDRVFHRMRAMHTAKQALRQIMGGDREQPRAKRGAVLFKGGKGGRHAIHIAMG